MKESNRLKKFFIICAAVCVIGLGCAIGGAAGGGVQGIEQMADRYDWIHGSPGERGVTAQKVDDFHAIEATGDADLWIVGPDYYEKDSWLARQELLDQTELDVLGRNQVCVICGDRMEQPEITVRKGVLIINSGTAELDGINLNLTDAPAYPQILVCVPDETLKSLTVSGQIGDVDVRGASWEKAQIQLNSGDFTAKNVKSSALNVEVDDGDVEVRGVCRGSTRLVTETGDVEIHGKVKGNTRIITQDGDVELATSLAREKYTLRADTEDGDIRLLEEKTLRREYEEAKRIREGSGPYRISVKTYSGDVDLNFLE